ncbi:MAG: radical SAM protein [Clostridia bacterium]|nr:radical SAM protein [Clostridia bacterium]
MKIGLIDVDNAHKTPKYPNLALMKLSAYLKQQGHDVDWWWAFDQYDRIYMSKVFDETYTPDIPEPVNGKEIIKGGTGYGLDNKLPDEVEHVYPDYSLYPTLTKDTAYGFLTRGCPRGCHFCIVADKEGRRSVKVADLSEFWRGQKNIVLMDANILAYKGHMELLEQLADSKARVDINQGIDARLLTEKNIEAINHIKIKEIHFAWDYMREEKAVLRGLNLYREMAARKPHGFFGAVYVLVNYDTTMEENLYRIYTLRDMGYEPYVMVYDKPNAPQDVRRLQRWCNNRYVFRTVPDFKDYGKRR